jgi:predicted nucleic acid-binding protein
MNDRVFLDTNILVYANDASEPEKQRVAREAIRSAILEDRAVVSVQVLGEFWVTVTQKIRKPLSREIARHQIQLLGMMTIVPLDEPLFQLALDLQDLHQLSYWDAMIVAAADTAGCDRLLTEDLSAGRSYGSVQIHNPFQ